MAEYLEDPSYKREAENIVQLFQNNETGKVAFIHEHRNPHRITSYNVCYTNLLREKIPYTSPKHTIFAKILYHKNLNFKKINSNLKNTLLFFK